jgi:hypothetical protein
MTNVINFDRAAMLKAALDYARLGWHVFPTYGIKQLDDGRYQCRCGDDECKSPGKHPYHKLAPQGHHSATTDEATIRKWFSGEHKLNLAISLEHSNLVAVDIDPRNGGLFTMEALEAKHGDLVSDVLQLTAGGGEHRVFSMPKNMGHLPGKLGKGVDLKANGYIVSWPSFGISGIQYGWEASSDPFAGAIPSPLPDWIRDLAFDRIELNHQPGSRFVTPEQISELQSALAFLSADDYHQWVNFGNALKSIGAAGYQLWDEWSRRSDKYDANQMGHKWRSFKPGAYNIESIFHEAMAAGWLNTIQIAPDVAMVEPECPPVDELPPDYTYQHEQTEFDGVFDKPIPGVLGDFEEWAYRSSLSATPSRHAARMAALGFGSIALARLYKTQRDNYSSLLLLQIDESGGGKEDLKTAIDKAMRLTGLHGTRMGGSWYTSDIGVISALHDKPAHITIVDEFGLKIANSRKKGNATSASALSAVMEASTKCHSSISSTAAGTRGLSRADAARMQMTIVNPGLSVVAMSTKTSMIEALTSDDITSGFLNRWVIMVNPTVADKPDYSRFFDAQPSYPLPESVRNWVDTYCPIATRVGGATAEVEDPSVDAEAEIIPFSKPAQALVIKYLDDIEQMKDGVFASAPEMTKRMNESAMRLSLIIALSDGKKTIGTEHFAWARDFITSHQIAAFRVLASQLAGTEFGKLRNSLLDFIRFRNDGHKVSRQDLGRSCRAWKESPKHLRDSAIAVLIEDGLIVREEAVTGAGRTIITYRALTDDAANGKPR